jgi:hypothetical protein
MSRGLLTLLILTACLGSALTAVPAARALPIQCDKSAYDVDLAVVHANGVLTTFSGAVANLQHLRPLIDQRLEQMPYAISYGVAYNEKKGFLESIQKVIRERLPMSKAETLRIINGSLDLPDDVRDEIAQLVSDSVESGFAGDPSLEKQVQSYRDLLRRGRKVLVVAHSEGNMYSNAAQRRLFGSHDP